jgi:hypothetical protein
MAQRSTTLQSAAPLSAQRCEHEAKEIAKHYSTEPGHYVLALPKGTVINAPTAAQTGPATAPSASTELVPSARKVQTVISQPSRPTYIQSTTKDAGLLPLGALVLFFFSMVVPGVFFLWLCSAPMPFGLSSSAIAFFIVILLVLFGAAVASGWSVISHRRNR